MPGKLMCFTLRTTIELKWGGVGGTGQGEGINTFFFKNRFYFKIFKFYIVNLKFSISNLFLKPVNDFFLKFISISRTTYLWNFYLSFLLPVPTHHISIFFKEQRWGEWMDQNLFLQPFSGGLLVDYPPPTPCCTGCFRENNPSECGCKLSLLWSHCDAVSFAGLYLLTEMDVPFVAVAEAKAVTSVWWVNQFFWVILEIMLFTGHAVPLVIHWMPAKAEAFFFFLVSHISTAGLCWFFYSYIYYRNRCYRSAWWVLVQDLRG